LKRAFDTRF